MFGGQKSAEKRREANKLADTAAENALLALREEDVARARAELAAVPKRVDFADIGWKVTLVWSLVEFADDKRNKGFSKLLEFCKRLDETSLTRDDKGYLRLFARYRAIENAKNGRPSTEIRELTENFRFDHTLVCNALKSRFPLKKGEETQIAPPPKAIAPGAHGDEF
ncbi:hypothetical protein [Woodsholea maritima]|uniref:hypothetical protein n=1 Tax=Woodsholea maritima TaxID=240237 RepID=UPI00036C5528|nr:hypothetical protein [Woodsholea maritima]